MGTEKTEGSRWQGKGSARDSLSIVTVCLDPECSSLVRRFIDSTPLTRLVAELRHFLGGEGDTAFVDRLQDLQPDVCLIDFDPDREKASRTAERIHESLPDASIFAASAKAQPDLIIAAMRSGCSEYLIKPLDRDQLLEALARVGGKKRERREQAPAQVICFLGAKGGTGVTTLAIHLSTLLAQRCHRHTLLVDLHPDLGDASVFLSLTKHQYHFYDLAENTHRLDAELLQGFLSHHASGLDLLAAPEAIDTTRHVPPESIGQTLEFLRQHYEFVIVDCPPGLSDQNLTAISQSDHLYLVATPEIPALRNTARYLEYLTRIDYPAERIRVVINRHSKSGPITDAQVEKAIHKSVYRKIPNQYGEVIKSINMGRPLLLESRSEFLRTLSEWAESLAGKPTATGKKEGKGVFGFFGR